jgi:hypothetical protein
MTIRKFNDFSRAEDALINKLLARRTNLTKNSRPSYKIVEIQTNINIPKEKCSATVKETVNFILQNGYFSLIIRKVSLAGSANSLVAFRLKSK